MGRTSQPPRGAIAAAAVLLLAVAAYFLLIRESDADKVRAAVRDYAEAIRERDFAGVCNEHITDNLRQQVRLVKECPEALEETLPEKDFDPTFEMKVVDVEVEDGGKATATVEVTSKRTRGKPLDGELPLEKEGDGEWRLAAFQ